MSENSSRSKVAQSVWNSLEIAKLVVGVLTPLSVVFLGSIYSRDSQEAQFNAQREALIRDKRMDIYDKVGISANDIFSYYMFVGRWKELSPEDILAKKREMDAAIYTYVFLFDDDFFSKYHAMTTELFRHYSGWGRDALLKTSADGRSDTFKGEWKGDWGERFTGEDNRARICSAYYSFINSLSSQLLGRNKKDAELKALCAPFEKS